MAILGTASVLLVANPMARRGRRIRHRVETALRAGVGTLHVRETTARGHARTIAREDGPAHAAVFSLGGDGTASEVADGLAGTGVPFGPLPGGTGNLLAHALGIPMGPEQAVRALLSGTPRAIDIGRLASGGCVVYAAGAGIDAAMIGGATAERKQRWGVATYFATGARAVFARESFRLRATVDGTVTETDAWAVFIANFGPVLGGLLHLGPDVLPDDGVMDLCIYSPATVRQALAVAWRMFRNDFRPHACMRFVRGREMLIETAPVRPFQSDGELVGETPMRLRVEPRALMVLAPDTRR